MNILLPIETINREIDFKIIIASILSGKGYKIYIGQHDFLMSLVPNMKNGIYFGKNIFSKRTEQEQGIKYHELKEKGIDIIYLHEEGAVYAGDEQNWEQVLKGQYNLDFFDENDKVCVWGDFQLQIDKARSSKVDVFVTGHPRFDLYKKQWSDYFNNEVESIKKSYGKYILINGNYGAANHGLGVKYVFSDAFNYNVKDIEARLHRVGFYSYSTKQLVSLVELTHRLAIRYPDKAIIYRPHPSENHDYYKSVFAGVDNIIVNHEGAVGAWILGADAMIHDGCTTAIEATLAGVPVINYKPIYDANYDIWLPNQLGKRSETINEVFDILDNLSTFNPNFTDNASFQKICDLFYNFKGDSFGEILELIDLMLSNKMPTESESPSADYIKYKYVRTKLKQEAVKVLSSEAFKRSKYHKIKFYGFNVDVISEKFKQAEIVLEKTVDFKIHNSYLIEVQ